MPAHIKCIESRIFKLFCAVLIPQLTFCQPMRYEKWPEESIRPSIRQSRPPAAAASAVVLPGRGTVSFVDPFTIGSFYVAFWIVPPREASLSRASISRTRLFTRSLNYLNNSHFWVTFKIVYKCSSSRGRSWAGVYRYLSKMIASFAPLVSS